MTVIGSSAHTLEWTHDRLAGLVTLDDVLGRHAEFRTAAGTWLTAPITGTNPDGYLVATLPDGRWRRLDDNVALAPCSPIDLSPADARARHPRFPVVTEQQIADRRARRAVRGED